MAKIKLEYNIEKCWDCPKCTSESTQTAYKNTTDVKIETLLSQIAKSTSEIEKNTLNTSVLNIELGGVTGTNKIDDGDNANDTTDLTNVALFKETFKFVKSNDR